MKAELKEKFIETLLSGKYVQLKKVWHDGGNGRCAAAILYELAGINFKKHPWSPDQMILDVYEDGKVWPMATSYLMKDEVLDKFDASEIKIGECNRIFKMNEIGKTFAEIADYIKSQP